MALDMIQIEQRLASVETALAHVQQKLGIAPAPVNWVEQVSGSLADLPEEDYQEFLKHCKAARNGLPASPAEAGPK